MSTAVLALGSNLGDRAGHLRDAVAGLAAVRRAVSGLYETPPWGDAEQPAYLNAVLLAVDVGATPMDWLRRAHALEDAAGRRRDPDRRYGPRTLDVDVIAVFAGHRGDPSAHTDRGMTPHPTGADATSDPSARANPGLGAAVHDPLAADLADPVVSDDPTLRLPHPRAAQRAFVLVPLYEMVPGLVLPGAGPVADLLRAPDVAVDVPGVRRIADGAWWQAVGDE